MTMMSTADILRVVFAVAYLAAAAVVYVAAPDRRANRLLTAAFMLEPVFSTGPGGS